MVLSLLRGRVAEIKTQGKADSKRQTANSQADAFVRTTREGDTFKHHLRDGLPDWLFAVSCLLFALAIDCWLFAVYCLLKAV
jgi:hypothetical protein